MIELYKELGLKESSNFLTNTKELTETNDKMPLSAVYEKHEWGVVLENIEKKIKNLPIIKTHSISDIEKISEDKILQYGAKAAFHLKNWDHLDNFTGKMNETSEKYFYEIILSIHNRDFNTATKKIKKMRKKMVNDVGSFGDYLGSYDKIMKMHQVRELEEILTAMKEEKEISQNKLLSFMLGNEEKNKLIKNQRFKLLQIWEDRILSGERSIDYWEMLISIRSLYASDMELVKTKRDFAKLCNKMEFRNLFKSTFQNLINLKKIFNSEKKTFLKERSQSQIQE